VVKDKLLMSPVPGMSLTTEPSSRPWEQAPKLTKLSEVVDHYAERLSDGAVIESIMLGLKEDVPVYELAEALTKIEMMNGMHSPDTAVLVTPVVVELIITLAELNDVGFVITKEDRDQMTTVDESIVKSAISEVTAANKMRKTDEEPVVEQKKGLMSRGNKE
jgi:hypothetical protein